ncbi:MAG: hypothetical protein JNJ73_07765 [Hyphomonadaceae bacterium]|nr:hypothetical protein [Hyphomonadaceae bacterium]
MVERGDLEAAADAGVIAREQVAPLAAFLATRNAATAIAGPAGEEELRFIRNFHDVFLAMGITILAVGFAVGIATLIDKSERGDGGEVWTLLIGSIVSAALLWGLGEVFSRKRRLFLPSIAIVIGFAVYAAAAAACVYGLAVGLAMPVHSADAVHAEGEGVRFAAAVMVFAAAVSLAALGFYLRFRLPFALGLAGGAAAGFVAASLHAFAPVLAVQAQAGISLLLGAALFAAAIAYDVRDPGRRTRYSDNGFWLHFAAAPLILGGVLGTLAQAIGGDGRSWMDVNTGESGAAPDGGAVPRAVATLAVVAALGFVSLLINRRALIVSALLTTGVAIGVIMNATGLGEGALIAATLVTLGGFVLVLGAGWHGARRALLRQVRPDGVWARVFPPEADDEGVREAARG